MGFTGKINILYQDNGQFVGEIFMIEGNLVHACYKGMQGKRPLFYLAFDDERKKDLFRYVPEPEIIGPRHISFNFSFGEFERLYTDFLTRHKKALNLRPPDHLKLRVNPEFIAKGDTVESEELEVLSTIVSYNQVDSIYHHASLKEFEVTLALVSLRKKNAILVL